MSTENDPDLSAFGFIDDEGACLVGDPPPPGLDPRVAPEVQALIQQEFEEKGDMLRKGTMTDPVPRMLDPKRLVDFINQGRRLTLEKIEANLVEETTPVMEWKLREFALTGQYTQARAVEIWLNWADKIRSRPSEEKRKPSAGSAAFLPRGTTIEGEAKPVEAKPRPHLGSAGKFIGKAKRLRAPKGSNGKQVKTD
jgi:hypothetical protein